MESVELGFVKKTAAWKLRSKFFPSKIGGKPAWLTLNNLPEPPDLCCRDCGNPYVFLLQLYANIEENVNAFHRTVLVFMCSNGKCIRRFSNDNFVVYRTQLPRKNDFYSHEPPIMDEKSSCLPSAEQYQTVCDVCGCKAVIQCEKCLNKNYCSEYHRKADWDWKHRDLCGTDITHMKKKKLQIHPLLLPEFEIESSDEDLPAERPEKTDEEKMQEYHQYMKSDKAPREFQDVPLDDLDALVRQEDRAYNRFRKRIDHEPEQILRYQRGGDPLLVSSEHVPTERDIPLCKCGARRTFEFQIMSQILSHLSLDSLGDSPDWGTLLVYTCSKSCDEGTSAYVKEFLWKQDFSH